jgi:hypothetical protein
MRSKANGALLVLLCVLVPATFAAQRKLQKQAGPANGQSASRANTSPHESLSQSFLLSPSEGLSVIGAALESRGRGRFKSDCSHLVHTIYGRAGLPYSYVSSSDLYNGVDEFQLVMSPQPGDLVVWPGHVGIVVNPSQNTFFSALRSGLGVEPYSSSYWKDLGRPRFYRYVKSAATEGRGSEEGTPSLTRASLDALVNTETRSSVDVNPGNIKLAGVQVINSARPQPEEITQALLLAFSLNPEGLREADVFKLAQSLIVFNRLEVRAVKLHGDQGRAEVRITAPVSVAGGQANLRKRQEIQTWSLRRRDQNIWELLLPQDAIYLPRDAAVEVLAHQLARLADSENSSANFRQKSKLAQMLNSLLAE